MKRLIVGLVGIAIVCVGVVNREPITKFFNNTTYVENVKVETIVETERVNELDVRLEEAASAAMADIEAKATAEYDIAVLVAENAKARFIANELKKVSDKVKGDYIAEIEATIVSSSY